MGQIPFWEADNCWASQEIPRRGGMCLETKWTVFHKERMDVGHWITKMWGSQEWSRTEEWEEGGL
jgi:hypothetical protein